MNTAPEVQFVETDIFPSPLHQDNKNMTTRRKFLRSSALGVAALATTPAIAETLKKTSENQVDDRLRAGIAREIITPKLGGILLGYGSDKGSTEVNDDLTVTALAIENGKSKIILMSITVCLISNELIPKLQTLCGEAAGVPASNVILSATHTHSGPDTMDCEDPKYCNEIFIPRCVAAAKASVKEMKPVTVGLATTESRVGINRRQLLPDDRVILGQNPWGPYDSEMTVISFKGKDGKSFANIIHCTAHPTAAGTNTEISRDWPGVMIDRLEKESGAMTMFVNGMCGDVAPRIPNGGSDGGRPGNIQYANEIGSLAALDAIRAYKDIREFRDEEMSVATGVISIPHAPLIPLDEARKELASLEAGRQVRFTWAAKRVYQINIVLHEKGQTGESFFTYNQTLVKIGPIVLVPVPFEVSCEIGMRLRAYSKYGHTLALGCTNGYNSYLPTRDQIPRGGYEVDRFLWSGQRQLVDNADLHLINENLKLMEKLM